MTSEHQVPGSTDHITLRGLRAYGYHGVFDEERRTGQEFVVDLTVWLDLSGAAVSDRVADTVDYGQLATLVVGIVQGPPQNLLETLAARIAAAVLEVPKVTTVQVRLHKPAAPIPHEFADVEVVLTRTRQDPI